MPRRLGTAVVGVVLLVTGILLLALPVTADDGRSTVHCGSGFAGLDDGAGLVDAARDLTADAVGDRGGPGSRLAAACEDKIGTRRLLGWPAGAAGLVLSAAAVLTATSRPRRPRRP